MNMLNPVQSFVNMTGAWQQGMRDKANEQNANQIESDAKTLYQEGLNSKNEISKKDNMSASNQNSLAGAILTYAKTKGKYDEYAGLSPTQIISKFLDKNKGRGYDKYVEQLKGGELSLEETTRLIGINQNVVNPLSMSLDIDEEDFDPTLLSSFDYSDMEEWNNPSKNDTRDPLTKWGIGIGTAVGTDAALYGAGKLGQRGGKQIYNIPIDKTMKESNKLISAGANIKDAEVAVKDAKQALKKAKSMGEGVEDAQKALATAQDTLENAKAKGKSIRTIGDTAMEYNIGGGVTEGWTAQSRGIQAKHEANQIFKKTIAPALENSKATINVQELIDGLADDIKEIAKNDPDKLNTYNEALESLKDSYKGEEFAKYSLKDTQTLKSGLQGRTPQKFWKGQEITNELQELKGLLSSKLKDALHSELAKEIGEDSAKLYLDRANLDAYSKSMAKQVTNAGLKQGFGGFWSTAFHNLTDGAFAKGGLLLDKVGSVLEKATNPKVWVEKTSGLIKSIKANPKLLLKGLKAISPADLIMPDGFELIQGVNRDEKLKGRVDRNRGDDITEDERYAIIGKDGYDLISEDGAYNTLEEKGWTPEGIMTLLDSIE